MVSRKINSVKQSINLNVNLQCLVNQILDEAPISFILTQCVQHKGEDQTNWGHGDL